MLKHVPTKCPSPQGGGSGHMVELTWVQFDSKGHFDRFIRFCRSQQCVQHTDGQTDHTTSLTTGPLFSLRHNNKSVSSLLRRLSTRRYPHLLLSAGTCSTAPAAIDLHFLPEGRSAANPPNAVAAVDRRETDGGTPDRYKDPAPHTTRAVSVIKRTFAWRKTRQSH